ncbi:hypothetical protein PLESTB_000003500 [Pleodorina starrii]|uniref:dCTP pyrophosphatase 1 n=1 Tax=Pleodorina starrii TaxID=330485 RepID=A0A9W6EX28_9CHLO|nr:hypothetical protein PLESTB_000003500 [Pleodorina starrii]
MTMAMQRKALARDGCNRKAQKQRHQWRRRREQQPQHKHWQQSPGTHLLASQATSIRTMWHGPRTLGLGRDLGRLCRWSSSAPGWRNWDQYHTPRNLLLALVGETGELSELFQWRPEAEAGPGLPGFSAGERLAVEEELADVLLYLVRLAERCDVDLGAAALAKMRKNAAKYPVERCHGSSAKYTAYDGREGEQQGKEQAQQQQQQREEQPQEQRS